MGRRRKNVTILLKTNIIFNLLAKSALSIKDLAERTGEVGLGDKVNYKYLSDLLSDTPRSIPTVVIVGKIAKALGVEPWQIAEGLEPPPDRISEAQAPYGHDTKAFNVYQIAVARAERAGLNEEERERMGNAIDKISDLLTTGDRQERERYAAVIYGMLALCQSVLSQQGGRESGESSSLSEKEKL